ncbi:MAG TPA: heparan-alpha-glucosaminide N-acetyltransferase domain-containing protein [Polyangiales bacterium]|nr:heparan-alpha-glucosaminide N-acetyltransferase domain-containing protein [Polyangiales bacterium]
MVSPASLQSLETSHRSPVKTVPLTLQSWERECHVTRTALSCRAVRAPASMLSLAPGERAEHVVTRVARRLRSLDVFRGITVLGMILVNASDLGGDAYPWLRHAEWNGLGIADLVFPSFLFIVGAAMGLSLRVEPPPPRADAGSISHSRATYLRILRRTLILFGLGLIANWAHSGNFEGMRIMGVLQRIALCYGFVAIVLMRVPRTGQYVIAGSVLFAYWAALAFIAVPAGSDATVFSMNLPSYVDRMLLGDAHLLRAEPYASQFDPEGLLSTLPASVNVLAGAFCARWLIEQPVGSRTSLRLTFGGAAIALIGLGWGAVFPINKSLWTSSFVLVSSGLAAVGLALCHEVVDVRSAGRWLKLCEILGLNAIAAYLLSSLIDIGATEVAVPLFADENTPYVWLREHVLNAIPAPDASLLFAVAELLLVWAVMYALYRRSWFLKI